jgi:tetratricopeptide (TPR) repeat protein
MEKFVIKYAATSEKASPPQRIRVDVPGWGGDPAQKMENGGQVQPWHCLPFVEGSTYGLELVYPYETECQVVNDGPLVRFEWDFYKEGAGVTGGEFLTFFPKEAPGQYLFSTRLDIVAPPGHVLRIEPHPRFFTDLSGTVPAAIIANVQSEWWSKPLFVVFKVPPPGGRHIFRKGEPYAQIIFVPQRVSYELTKMTPEEEAHRRELSQGVEAARSLIATNLWINAAGKDQANHYKVLAAAFARDGMAGVEKTIGDAVAEHQRALPADKNIPECMMLGAARMKEHKYVEARDVFGLVLARDPNNAEAMLNIGICLACIGATLPGLEAMREAVRMQPNAPAFRAHLGEMLRRLGRFEEAETAFRASLHLNPSSPGILSVLGLTAAQRGRHDEGLEICQRAIAMNPRVALVHYRKGLILAMQGKTEAARQSYQEALSIDPNFVDAQRALKELPAGA